MESHPQVILDWLSSQSTCLQPKDGHAGASSEIRALGLLQSFSVPFSSSFSLTLSLFLSPLPLSPFPSLSPHSLLSFCLSLSPLPPSYFSPPLLSILPSDFLSLPLSLICLPLFSFLSFPLSPFSLTLPLSLSPSLPFFPPFSLPFFPLTLPLLTQLRDYSHLYDQGLSQGLPTCNAGDQTWTSHLHKYIPTHKYISPSLYWISPK